MQPFDAVLFIMCIGLILCYNQTERKLWARHNNITSEKSFRCKVPQPRVFYIEDLMEENKWKSEYKDVKHLIRPPATVLHRCESAGCCDDWKERCLPTNTESIADVTLIFGIVYENMVTYFEQQAKNHTDCRCRNMNDT